MENALLVTLIVGIFSPVVSLIGIFVASKDNREKTLAEFNRRMSVNEAVNSEKLNQINNKIEEHNGYAKMFQENIPAINQHMKDIDRRLNKLEGRN